MYIDNHPLAMLIEGDELIVNVGDWLKHEKVALKLVFILTKSMIQAAVGVGHDVVVPYLVRNASEIEEIETLAKNSGAEFHEYYLNVPKDEAIRRLFKRGVWGEAGVPPITKDDMPVIEQLYAEMEAALPLRPNQIYIDIEEGKPEETYQKFLAHLT